LRNFSILRVISILTIFTLALGAATVSFILFGLEQDSALNQQIRSKLGLGLAYSASDLKTMPNELLIQVLASEMPKEIQKAAILEAVQRNTEELANTVSTVLSDSRSDVRLEAIKAIAAMPSLPLATRKHCLLQSLHDSDPFIRSYAAAELASIEGKKAKDVLKKQREREKDIMVAKIIDMILSKF
jgi:HEAT repeat protein